MNNVAIDIIKKFEGVRLTAYLCPAGIPTIGYGHTSGVKLGQTITQKQADDMLLRDIELYEQQILSNIGQKIYLGLSENQKAAIISFVFNIGIGNFSKSTLKKKLLKLDIIGTADEFLKWSFAGGKKLRGLETRRIAERELFLRNK